MTEDMIYTNQFKVYVNGIYKGDVTADDRGLTQIPSKWLMDVTQDCGCTVSVNIEPVRIQE